MSKTDLQTADEYLTRIQREERRAFRKLRKTAARLEQLSELRAQGQTWFKAARDAERDAAEVAV